MEEEKRSFGKYKGLINPEVLAKKTHFSPDEVRALQSMYLELTSGGKPMDRLRFREVMFTTWDITDDVMLDRIFRAFDTDNNGVVDGQEWVLGLSIFLKGSLEEQISFAYFCYDINGDRSLAREELYHCLKNCLLRTSGIEEDVEESVKELVEIAMKKLDMDKNGQITFPDYQAAVQSDPLLLEACGPCLPTMKAVAAFFLHLNEKYGQAQGKKQGSSGSAGGSGMKRKRASLRNRSSSYSPRLDHGSVIG